MAAARGGGVPTTMTTTPGHNIYDYTGTAGHPAYSSDTGLHAPLDHWKKLSGISYYLVCGQPVASLATPTVTTTPSAGGTVNSVVLNDSATLSGGSSPGGSITFDLYSPSQTCGSGAPAYTQTVTVSGNGSYSTTNTVAANAAGTWSWTAMYSGDSANNGASSTCGQETVKVTADGRRDPAKAPGRSPSSSPGRTSSPTCPREHGSRPRPGSTW